MLDSAALDSAEPPAGGENKSLPLIKPGSDRPPVREYIAESPQMREALNLATEVARFNVPILIEGETGTGKSYLAQYIHDRSNRADRRFIAQDCAALAEPLLDSELFGHARGAFTGAHEEREGLFAAAHQGTMFLDEIENAPAALQAKLLRVLETGEFRAVGSTAPRRADVRLIAASNHDLLEEIERGSFRRDLYYRLNAVRIVLAPLRARPDDILPLAFNAIKRSAEALEREPPVLAAPARRALVAYDWPGNIRELNNACWCATLVTPPGSLLGLRHLREPIRSGHPRRGGGSRRSLKEQMADFERQVLQAALERNGGVLRRAAQDLGVNAVTLGRRVRRYGLDFNRRSPNST